MACTSVWGFKSFARWSIFIGKLRVLRQTAESIKPERFW
jgi:hypothetical protein